MMATLSPWHCRRPSNSFRPITSTPSCWTWVCRTAVGRGLERNNAWTPLSPSYCDHISPRITVGSLTKGPMPISRNRMIGRTGTSSRHRGQGTHVKVNGRNAANEGAWTRNQGSMTASGMGRSFSATVEFSALFPVWWSPRVKAMLSYTDEEFPDVLEAGRAASSRIAIACSQHDRP
jgi:hypothetical protein